MTNDAFCYVPTDFPEFDIHLFKSMQHLHLEYWKQLVSVHLKKDTAEVWTKRKNCSDQNKLKEITPCPRCGSVEEPFAAEVVGAGSEFKKHLDMMGKKNHRGLLKKNISPLK